MAFTVQDDNGLVAGANAYAAVADFKTWAVDHGYASASTSNDVTIGGVVYTNAQIEKAIVRATAYLDQRFRYKGTRLQRQEQTTQFPRSGCFNRDGDYVDGVPLAVKNATFEYTRFAIVGDINPNPEYDATGRAVVSTFERVGPLASSKRFTESAIFQMPRYPAADNILKTEGLTESGLSRTTVRA